MFKRVRCRIEKCVKFSDLYRLQEPEVLYDSEKAYKATNEVVSHIVTIQLLHIIFIEKSEWESKHFVKTWARYVNKCLRWQSTALYNINAILWDVVQAYTDCLNDSNKYTEFSACMRSRSVWWDHRSWTDVNKDWSKRWVIWWALSNNSRTTEILFYHSESKNVHNKMLFKWWRKAALSWETLNADLRISLYETNSVYTWLDNNWTLRKRCNLCFLIETVLLTQNVTECLYILQKLW